MDATVRSFEHPVEIVAVTKGFDGRAVEAAAAAGCTTIGENYAQDLLSKAETIERCGVGVHFIGRLQSNKVSQIAHLVTRWSSIDRSSILAEVAKRAPAAHILLQVNATGEDGKGGCRPGDVAALLDMAGDAGLVVDGLMTVGPTGQPAAAARPAFELVRSLVDDHGLSVCSMGMSGDLEVAVESGSTEVRVGSALFGPRPPR
jgi:pyridoxal phosphate enzyme (YggS family)